MALNVYKNIINSVNKGLANLKVESTRKIYDKKELENILNVANNGMKFYFSDEINISANEAKYDNGLIYLNVQINFLKTAKSINEMIFTFDYKESPLININVQNEKMAIEELLVKENNENLFSNEEKNIGKKTIAIDVLDICNSFFQVYFNQNEDNIMVEKYRQIYPASGINDNLFLRLCGCNSKDLEIIYKQNEPIYAQFSNEDKIEMANLHPILDVYKVVEIIGQEIDNITNAIEMTISNQNKKKIKI